MASRKFKKAIVGVGFLGVALLGFQNCSKVNFGTFNSLEECLKDPDADCGGETGNALKLIQPAVAVRGASCLMCHAQIHANVITDFGFGENYFFGGTSGINEVGWYNNYVNAWQSVNTIVGSVYVPNATIPAQAQSSMGLGGLPPLSVVDAMNTAYNAPGSWGSNTPEEGHIAMSAKVAPPTGPKVIAKNTIVIRAPSDADIVELAPAFFGAGSVGAVMMPNSQSVAGLNVNQGTTGPYVTNNEFIEIQCAKKDIVVNGSLYLRRLKVNASGGCRIYVKGSVFVEEAITYGSGPDQSVQITSSNIISLGIGLNGLNRRLIQDSRGLNIAGPKSYDVIANQTLLDAQNIAVLKDAQDDYPGTHAVDFNGVLLNAPIIHSRYLGEVRGAVIAQAAIFALGEFHFHFDPVFTRIDALPLLRKPVLGVQ